MACQRNLSSVLFILSFFSLVMNWRFTRGVEEQTKSLMDGFNEIVPLEWINIFDEKELEVRGCVSGEEIVMRWDSMHSTGSKIFHPTFSKKVIFLSELEMVIFMKLEANVAK